MQSATQQRVLDELGRPGTRSLMVRTARRVVPEHDCEDAAHDAVVQALTAADGFRQDAQVCTWLYRIAFNAALMQQRSTGRSGRRLVRAQQAGVEAPGLGLGSAAPLAPAVLEEDERRRLLRAAVEALPDGYREVVERCVYEEQVPRRVARELGITPGAVRTRFARARAQLRDLLGARARRGPRQAPRRALSRSRGGGPGDR
jgi:RNA polymerase sigma-70 factor (ECF subfamily)